VSQSGTKRPERRKRWRRRLLSWGVPLVLAWLALSHFLIRPRLESFLAETFVGEPRVRFALLLPDASVSAFGVEIEAEHHRLAASRVWIDLRPFGLLGARPVERVALSRFVADIDEGGRLRLLRDPREQGSEAGPDADLDPATVPPLTFHDPEIHLVDEAGARRRVFGTRRLDVRQIGDRVFRMGTGPGELATAPFERLTARVIPRGSHVVFSRLKVRAFDGVAGGMIDVDTARAGAFNGELEWHLVEVEEIWSAFGLPYAEKRRGEVSGRLVFEGSRFSPGALQGKGWLELSEAEFYSPLSFEVFLVLKIPSAQEAPLNRARVEFSFEKELVYVERARAYAREFDLHGQGLIRFDGRADLEVRHAGTMVAVRGSLESPTVRVLPLDHVTAPFDRLFRERIEAE
jgi:hypothetical protein